MHFRSAVLFSTLIFPTLSSATPMLPENDNLVAPKATHLNLSELRENRSKSWGVAATFRNASIPYSEGGGAHLSSFVPMMFYDGENVFWSGLEGGLRLWKQDDWHINALIRMRFFDLPLDAQNEVGGDTGDLGLQLKRQFGEGWYSNIDLLSDDNYRYHAVGTVGKRIESKDYLLEGTFSVQYKDANFNSFYYGLSEYRQDGVRIGAGIDFKAGIKGRYHLYSNLYLVGGAYATYFDENVRKAPTINSDWQNELYLGIAVFNDNRRHGIKDISIKSYWRLAHGWATPSNIGEIFSGETVKDPHENQLTSLTYGYPLSDNLFGIPLDIFISPSFVWHWPSDVQSSAIELVAAIKGYYTVNWPTKWRIGIAEGLSYTNRITYIEQTELDKKGYKPSQLLNYVDFSIDVNIGDLFGRSSLDGVWFGYSVHHRSAIFENSSQFGRIKGGSNYNTLYLQMDI